MRDKNEKRRLAAALGAAATALAAIGLVFAACGGEKTQDTPRATPLAPPQGIFLVNADGTALRQLYDGPVGTFSWSPDGQRIALMTVGEELVVVDVGTGDVRDLGTGGRSALAWSPDGRSVLFIGPESGQGSDERFVMQIVEVDTGERRTLEEGRQPAWSPDGKQVSYAPTCEHWRNRRILNLETGESQELAPALPEAGASPSPDWKRIAYFNPGISPQAPNGTRHIYVADFDGTNEQVLPGEVSPSTFLDWSPDGAWLAYSSRFPGEGSSWGDHPYVVASDGSQTVVALAERGWVEGWSPDSRYLVVNESPGLFFYGVDTGANLAFWSDTGYHSDWSPDSLSIAFVAPARGGNSGGADLYVADVQTLQVHSLTEAPIYAALPKWSPDGRSIAFMAIGGGFDFGYCL